MSDDSERLRLRVEEIRGRIDRAARSTGRTGDDVTLVGVTKTVDRTVVEAAYAAGLRTFGENRVADARAKFDPPLPQDARLHLVGQLQTNKAGHAVDLFDVIESVDRPSLVAELEKQGARRERVIRVLLQVNVAGEEQKAGCALGDVDVLVDALVGAAHLELRGLMTIAPLVEDVEETRSVFRALRERRDRLVSARSDIELPVLSMGMTNDFEVAVQEGATHVRIGRALFG